MNRFTGRVLTAAVLSLCALPCLASQPSAKSLAKAAPAANPQVIQLALQATSCAVQSGQPVARRLAVIDYSLPSTKPRLWVFDLETGRLEYEELVAHGRNSGENYARSFSNENNSRASSLGLFRAKDTYNGGNGYSLRLQGLEPGVNDRAEQRSVVMHGAPYVDPKFIKTTGRLGRSWGCPAVRQKVARTLIDDLKGGQYPFSYYPDQKWLATSRYLHCGGSGTQTADAGSTGASSALASVTAAP